MSASQILKSKGREIVSVGPQETVAAAVAILAERRIGAVLVLGGSEAIAGILSERDIVRAVARDGAGALNRPVSDYMTTKVVTVREDDAISDLMEVMTNGKFRHLPVVEGTRLVGIISIGDVVKFRVAETEAEAQALRDYITT